MTSFRLLPIITLIAACPLGIALAAGGRQERPAAPPTPWLIAHRGASAYAPENTVPAFRLAAEQGSTFVEFDLRLTKDGHIVCMHDESLERTTNVEEVFPDRFRASGSGTLPAQRWLLEDFTLAELKRLDAGSWFDQKFRGTTVPTFGETIDALRGRSGLFIELKSPERYGGIEKLVLAELKAKGLDQPGADPRTPVLLQSFTASSLEIFMKLGTRLPIHFLVSARDAAPWLTAEGLERMETFATGISPEKTIVLNHTDAMKRARAMGLLITPYTFRAGAVPGFPNVRAEMAHYLDVLGVEGVITDNPDQMPTVTRGGADRRGGTAAGVTPLLDISQTLPSPCLLALLCSASCPPSVFVSGRSFEFGTGVSGCGQGDREPSHRPARNIWSINGLPDCRELASALKVSGP